DGALHALLDAARDGAVREALRASGDPFVSLYAGRRARQLDAVAPHLVVFGARSPLLRSLLGDRFGAGWGVLFRAHASLTELRAHFRRFLVVETEDDRTVYFRFYDPRVLPTYIASANEKEVDAFFGPVNAFYVETRARSVLVLTRTRPIVPAPRAPWN